LAERSAQWWEVFAGMRATDEYAEAGAFIDCTEKQKCCVKKEKKPSKDILQPEDPGRKGKE